MLSPTAEGAFSSGLNRLRGLAPLVAGFLLLALVGVSALWLYRSQQAAAAQLAHTLEVQDRINVLQTVASDAETGQRGYLLTGRKNYLAPYEAAVIRLPRQIETLKQLTADNPRQQALIAQLLPAIEAKLSELKTTIALRERNQVAAAMRIVEGDSGRQSMRRIRDTLSQMRAEETLLRERRAARAASLGRWVQAVLFVSFGLVLLLTISSMWEGVRRISELETANDDLTREQAERRAAENQLLHFHKMEAVGQLTGGVAHDFNNMLAVIIGSLDLARRKLNAEESPQVAAYIDAAREGAKRGAELTSRLLAFSRKQTLSPRFLDLNRSVQTASELLRRTLPTSISIETVLAGGLWRVNADPVQIENAIVNMAINARDAMPNGGRLTIETGNANLDENYARAHSEVKAGQYAMFSITDTGSGMAPEIVERAFDPFFTTKEVGRGTGLGLSQVFGFVKQSGGHVKIYSELGVGTTIKIYLPRHFGEETQYESAPRRQPIRRGDAAEIVLVVEDDPSVREMSVVSLRDLGYTVIPAADPKDALAIIQATPSIALLFTDVVMPLMSGRALVDAAYKVRPNLKVLYTTGYTRNAVVHNGVLDPGTFYLPKPFTLDELSQKVREVLDLKT